MGPGVKTLQLAALRGWLAGGGRLVRPGFAGSLRQLELESGRVDRVVHLLQPAVDEQHRVFERARQAGVQLARPRRLDVTRGVQRHDRGAVDDPVGGTWGTVASLNEPRAGLVAASVGGLIYAMGGRSGASIGSGTLFVTNEVYDPSTDTWTEMSPMPLAEACRKPR